jgi:ribose 5-phosphate isomerase B
MFTGTTDSKIYLASDHAGLVLKRALLPHLAALGYEAADLGSREPHPDDDYPDLILPFARRVAAEPGARGIAFGGSGQGEAMAANRIPGVRAAVFYGPARAVRDLESEGGASEDAYDIIRLARRHNNANILSIGARFVTEADAREAVRIFLETPFSGMERHVRRLAKF